MHRFTAVWLAAVWLAGLAQGGEAAPAEPGAWTPLGPTGGSVSGALVYAPERGQVLRWGSMGNPHNGQATNEVSAFEAEKRAWTHEYAPDTASLGGSFYGGQSHAGWVVASGRPAPFMLFRLACWDSKRKRMVVAAHNLTAAYDPATKGWTDLKAGWIGADGKRVEGSAPTSYEGAWFAPVPGQWGSMCYDEVNDEYVIFPLWITRSTRSWRYPELARTELPDEAGVAAGHLGTLVYDPNTNAWRAPELGAKEMLAARAKLGEAIGLQRLAVAAGWKALIGFRQEKADDAAQALPAAGAAQKQALAVLAALRGEWEKPAGSLSAGDVEQFKEAAAQLARSIERGEKALAGLNAGKIAELPALCAQQQALYRELRILLREDLYVQPTPRCSTSVVYDAKNRCIVMAGGTRLDRLLNDTWVYDCASRRWRRKAPAPEAADWPGMCFDSKRGVVLYATTNGTYAYDAAQDCWSKAGAGRPKGLYCDLAYDAKRDRYVLAVSNDKHGKDEAAFELVPADGAPVAAGTAAPREAADDAAFPPPADAETLARLKALPANTWTLAKPPKEVTGRSWSTMSWDPALRCVIYQGGGHGGTMDNTISAYFPECNLWVNAFPSQYPPAIFGYWSDALSMPSFERGVGLSFHARGYESYAGRIVYGGQGGFEWATRDKPKTTYAHVLGEKRPAMPGSSCLHPAKALLVGLGRGQNSGDPINGSSLHLGDLLTGETRNVTLTGPVPKINCEWSGLAVHPDRNVLVLHGAGDSKKQQDTETWVLDLANPSAWTKVETGAGAPRCGMGKLSVIPGTPYAVLASQHYEDLWVLNLDKKKWAALGSVYAPGAPKKKLNLYGQCVYAPETGVFVRKGDYDFPTLLLRPDFSGIKWE
ncbi:MAG: hypothetical protein AMXMBFR7_06240 [Planctomycetota bacterium]